MDEVTPDFHRPLVPAKKRLHRPDRRQQTPQTKRQNKASSTVDTVELQYPHTFKDLDVILPHKARSNSRSPLIASHKRSTASSVTPLFQASPSFSSCFNDESACSPPDNGHHVVKTQNPCHVHICSSQTSRDDGFLP